MSTLWTPGGERPIRREPDPAPAQQPSAQPTSAPPQQPGPQDGYTPYDDQPELSQEQMRELQEQLAAAPVELVIANHCYGIFELAALHLSVQPPQLPQARVAIDALACLVDGLAGRLGEQEEQLKEGLAQLKMAFVQLQAATPPNSGN